MSMTTGEFSSLALDFDRSLNDSCIHYTFVSGTMSAGQEIPVYSTGTSNCGFKPARALTNFLLGQVIAPEYDAELRLSLMTSIAGKDIIGFSGKQYKVEGINVGKTGKVVFLKFMDV